jgi:hypothetical protein
VLHTHGRHGQSPPPLQGLATRGGEEAPGECWAHPQSLPSALLRRTWPWQRLTMLRPTRKTEALDQWVDPCCRTYPDGLVPNVPQGALPAQAPRVARDVATDVVSPPIAVRRRDRYDGPRVP